MKFGGWVNKNDTQETADPSIASEDAIAHANNDDDDDSSRREEGRAHDKLPITSKGQKTNNEKKNHRMIFGVAALMLIIIGGVVFATIVIRKNKSSNVLKEEEDRFDFSDIDATGNPTGNPTISSTGQPSATPSILSFDFGQILETQTPSSKPPTQAPTKSYSPTESPSKSPSLPPSTTPPTGSQPPSRLPSVSPTFFPTKPVGPFETPPIVPFNDEDLDSMLTFCVIADAPYTQKEVDDLPNQIATQMEGCEFLVHLGDIFIGDTPCDIEDYLAIQNIMLESHVPAFLVPGDNEWNDCTRGNIDIGWNHWTNHFLGFEDNWNHTFSIIRQPGYEENFYFVEKRTLVVGLNIVAGRVHDKTEWKTRLQSEYSWVRDIIILNLVNGNTADGVILMAHAHPTQDHQEFFNHFRVFLRDELKNEFPVLYLHGDGHDFLYTPNYHNQSNFLRIQHEGGTIEPVLKIMARPGRGPDGRSSVYDAFQYDRQLELMNTNQKRD